MNGRTTQIRHTTNDVLLYVMTITAIMKTKAKQSKGAATPRVNVYMNA